MFVIFVTAAKRPETVDRFVASNPDRVLNKPFNVAELRKALAETVS